MKKYFLYILLLLFITYPVYGQSFRPSYKQGYARSASESIRPNLWKGLVFAQKYSLGVTGTTTTRDVSAVKNHGTMNGSMTIDDWVISGNLRMPGYALNLDGGNDHISIPDRDVFDSLGGTEFLTFCIWVKITALPASGESAFFSKQDDYEVSLEPSGEFGLRTYGANTITGSPIVSTGKWVFLVLVWHIGVDATFYINSVFQKTSVISDTSPANSNVFAIGLGDSASSTRYLNSIIDNSCVYIRKLLLSEISDMYKFPNAMFQLRDAVLVKPPAAPPSEELQVIIISKLMNNYFKGFEFLYN